MTLTFDFYETIQKFKFPTQQFSSQSLLFWSLLVMEYGKFYVEMLQKLLYFLSVNMLLTKCCLQIYWVIYTEWQTNQIRYSSKWELQWQERLQQKVVVTNTSSLIMKYMTKIWNEDVLFMENLSCFCFDFIPHTEYYCQ